MVIVARHRECNVNSIVCLKTVEMACIYAVSI